MAIPDRRVTAQGFEMQLGTNHIGHFVLTNYLIDSLKAGSPSRIVNVSSMAHRRGGIVFEDINLENNYDGWRSYGQSKTANILHAVELQNRLSADGITAVSLHPGVIRDSDLWRHTETKFDANKTVPQGASTSVFCCVAPNIIGGAFYNDCVESSAASYATDKVLAQKLWEVTDKLLS